MLTKRVISSIIFEFYSVFIFFFAPRLHAPTDRNPLLYNLLRKLAYKTINVTTTIVTGFSLHPTLALAFWIVYICSEIFFYEPTLLSFYRLSLSTPNYYMPNSEGSIYEKPFYSNLLSITRHGPDTGIKSITVATNTQPTGCKIFTNDSE